MITRGAKLNWRKHLTGREHYLIARADELKTRLKALEAELKTTNWQAIADRAIERARAAGDFL